MGNVFAGYSFQLRQFLNSNIRGEVQIRLDLDVYYYIKKAQIDSVRSTEVVTGKKTHAELEKSVPPGSLT